MKVLPPARLRRILLPALFGLGILGLWLGAKAWANLPDYQLPGPLSIFQASVDQAPVLLNAAWQTGLAAVIGFVTAVFAGFFIAMLLGFHAWIREMLFPWVLFLQMIPVVILAPIFVLWLGQGLPSITAVTFIISFFPIVANTVHGFSSVPLTMVDLFRMGGAKPMQELWQLRVPFALPFFLTGVKIAATVAPIGAITGDILAGAKSGEEAGLGYIVLLFNSQFNIPALYASAVMSCLLGFVFVGAVWILSWWLLKDWHESFTNQRAD
ncbi:MAG: ABC transporter permease [Opitutales bacterium]